MLPKEYIEYYESLVNDFCDEVCEKIDIKEYLPEPKKNFAPAPFLPIIGNGYYDAKVKVAIFGMETLYWYDLYRFIKNFRKKKSLADVKDYTDGIEGDLETYKNRFHNHHATPWYKKNHFWGFAYSALACIYGISVKELKSNSDWNRSFIWGNVNSYEKFGASWSKNKKLSQRKSDWEKISKASKRFDSAQLLLPYTHPQIMVVFHWAMTRKWLTGKDGDWEPSEIIPFEWQDFSIEHSLTEEQTKNLVHYIRCYYLVESKTFVLHTMHPSGMNPNHKYWKGNGLKHDIWKAAIKHALRQIKQNGKFSSGC